MALISHKYKFIFVKTVKTAGTAIEVTLSSLMGEEDIVTPIYPLETGHRARNFETPRGEFFNHMPAQRICAILGSKTFDNYYKFCVERDPVDKCLSHYSMLKYSPYHNDGNENLTWPQYVKRQNFPIDLKKYRDDAGCVLVNRILSYEKLNQELSDVLLNLGVPFKSLTSNAKSGFRKNGPKLEEVSKVERDMITAAFQESTSVINGLAN